MNIVTLMIPTHDHGPGDYMHDWRCMGECGPCGGCAGVDVGVGFMPCMYCGGSGACRGCNGYNARSED